MNTTNRKENVIVALDTPDLDSCKVLLESLEGVVSYYKVGSELFTACGTDVIRLIKDSGAKVFLDLKFYDIPNTVASVSRVVARLGVDMFNVHATGGAKMMQVTRQAVDEEAGSNSPLILGVTILTSFSENEMQRAYRMENSIDAQVTHLAGEVKEAGLDGVVASAHEVKFLKEKYGEAFKVVTPGVRPKDSDKGDQARIVTPREAFDLGADYIVIGRPITKAEDPRAAAEKIMSELE